MRVVVHSAAIQDRDGAGPHAGSTARAEPASETLPETGPLRRGWREGEPQTLPVIRLRRRDQQGSRHIPSGRSASSIDASPRKVDGFLTRLAILCARKASSESPLWLHLKSGQ